MRSGGTAGLLVVATTAEVTYPMVVAGMLLPMLRLLAHWMVPSQVHYGVSLLSASIAYASFGYIRKSMLYWGQVLFRGMPPYGVRC
ncbi:MAG TPA: hypothetical protein VM260_09185 [Pirellula sp.]|nr:hypothetical protein [Pirellula sp.]